MRPVHRDRCDLRCDGHGSASSSAGRRRRRNRHPSRHPNPTARPCGAATRRRACADRPRSSRAARPSAERTSRPPHGHPAKTTPCLYVRHACRYARWRGLSSRVRSGCRIVRPHHANARPGRHRHGRSRRQCRRCAHRTGSSPGWPDHRDQLPVRDRWHCQWNARWAWRGALPPGSTASCSRRPCCWRSLPCPHVSADVRHTPRQRPLRQRP